jgi:uncharacterized membrane protein YedE/YeeE
MEPLAPVAKIFAWGANTEAIAAMLLGVGFGFFLEKGGFGNSRVLAGQWYGYNFAVLRVMFTAIVTAMVGLFGLRYLGVVNFELVHVNETFLWPQVVGGLIFGVGFAVGQFCPGTAFVGCATGKVDAFLYVFGFLGGAVLFGFAYPAFSHFYDSSSMGRVLLSDWLHVPAGVVVFGVVMMALGAFAFTHWLDKKLAKKPA